MQIGQFMMSQIFDGVNELTAPKHEAWQWKTFPEGPQNLHLTYA